MSLTPSPESKEAPEVSTCGVPRLRWTALLSLAFVVGGPLPRLHGQAPGGAGGKESAPTAEAAQDPQVARDAKPTFAGFERVEPGEAGLDPERLAALDGLFGEDVREGNLVGCLGLVSRGGKVAYCETFGHRDRAAGEEMTEDTIFRIYSMSKPITSVAVMMLVERGKLELDAPVTRYLPELGELRVRDGDGEEGVELERPITVRDLLRHTSGMTYGFFGDTPVDQAYRRAGVLSRQADLEELVEVLGTLPLLHQPGTRFQYSVSTDVLGRVVEVASEMSFGAFLETHLFGPLGMDDTSFTVPKEKQHRLAEMYAPGRDGSLEPAGALRSWRFLNENDFESGGGGLCSTAADYLHFAQMMLGEGALGDVRILKAETVAEMTRDQLAEIPGGSRGFRFGLGVSIDRKGRYGWGGAAGTRFWIDPEAGEVGIFMVQINPYRGADYEGRMKRIVEGARVE